MNDKKITVIAIVPAYNAGEYLRECIESLILQTWKLDKIIIIDDASTDGSIDEILGLYPNTELLVSRNEKNSGRAASVNRILKSFDADYYILQDADDIAKKNRVERQIAFMESNPELGLSSSFVHYINSNGIKIAEGKLDLLDDKILAEYLSGGDPFGLYCPAVIMRREVAKDTDCNFRAQFWPADDIDLWNRVAENGYIVRVQPEFLVEYRVHGTSAVTSGFKRTRMQFEWLRSCLRARRSGLPEPTHEEFLREWNSAPWWRRLNRSRKFLAKGFYRAAGFAMAERSYVGAGFKGAMAVLLQPGYALRRAASQLRNHLG